MKSFQVYIPTLKRIGRSKQVTLREFKEFSDHTPVLVCPPNEVSEHMIYHKFVSACPKKGIGPTRQWIVENATEDIVIMADDDMRFSYRPDPKKVKLEKCEDLNEMLDLIIQCVKDGYIHGGVGARQGNNRKDLSGTRNGIYRNGHVFQDCERVNNFHFLDRKAVVKSGVRFDQLEVMEDFHFTLSLLLQGKPNTVIHDYVWNQEGSGAEGGCSGYRTPEVQSSGAEGLAAAFPEYVKVVTKVSKDTSPAWKDFKERKDVIVQWIKAYRSTQKS